MGGCKLRRRKPSTFWRSWVQVAQVSTSGFVRGLVNVRSLQKFRLPVGDNANPGMRGLL